jgi:ketosteroid isomerase-like protein
MAEQRTELETRLDAIETRLALRDLVSRYAKAVDTRSLDDLSALFAPDARFGADNGSFDAEGKAAIMADFQRQFMGMGPSFHAVHDQIIDLDPANPDRASGITTCHAEVLRDDTMWLGAVRYTDRYVRVDGRWRFAERMLGFFYYLRAKDYVGSLDPVLRFRLGTLRPADWPEKLESWQGFYRADAVA